uniref:RNA helicase n=1 Tax=Pyxicephalus adspersus TaxID=30357 RepID=A0AAV3B3B9_PYXAD|nr:TPA: hypothetical protein GDO54_001598 [Pyxicephalus adspersus]
MAAHPLGSRPRTGDVLQATAEAQDFKSLLLSRPVLEGLEAAGFIKPSPVQSKAIPLGRCGLDLIVQAKSGTGKTCVFSTVALDSLILENSATQILILAPTREIAVQIHSVIITIGSRMEGLECHVFIGGTPLPQDKPRLKKCHIAVGSPGRIKQLIEIGYLNTAHIRLFILDEADKLLEEGSFQEQINWIYSSLPANKQMLAVSATYPEFLARALTTYMREPMFVRLNAADPSLIGSMNQNQRLDAMAKLKQYHCRVLISTDLTSRGIDAEKVNLVINLDVPRDWETYMHRIGRAGRFGTYGLSVSYCCRGEEENLMMSIAQKCNLHLLPLPDPIPDGLMEEACDWDIEVTPVKITSDHLSVYKGVPSQVKEDDVVNTNLVDRNSYAEHSINKTVSKAVQRKPKKIVKKKTVEGAMLEGISNVETSSLSKKQKDTSKPTETVTNMKIDDGVQDMLGSSLPKIPSLSSFKRPVVCTSSFAELVEDYERFIKEGLEKHVEIIRVYTGSGSHTNTQMDETMEEENNVVMPLDTTSTSEIQDITVNSDQRTESSSSSSLSESDSEESLRSQGNRRSIELSSSCPDLFTERTDGTNVAQINVKSFNKSLEEVQQSSLVKAKAHCNEEPVFSNVLKPRKRNKKVTHISRRELCQETQDDMYQLDYRNPSGFPYGTMNYADYWRSYYQAWQSYHSAISSSYYRKLYKCSNWMSAYHMHSVYLHEMLKP